MMVVETIPPVNGGMPAITNPFHNHGTDEISDDTHTQQTTQTNHNSPPLFHQLLQTDDGTDVDQQKKNPNGVTERQQSSIGYDFLGENRPIPKQHHASSDKH